MAEIYAAHILDNGNAQPLKEHLENTEKLSGKFGLVFNNESFAAFCGRLHDVGKYSDKFQRRLRGAKVSCDHSTAGAELAIQNQQFGWLAAYCIAGHHSGLLNGGDKSDCAGDGTMYSRFAADNAIESYDAYKTEVPVPLQPIRPNIHVHSPKDAGFACAFFIRMIYSCLTDADFLDTEHFMNPEKVRLNDECNFQALLTKLDEKLAGFAGKPGIVNEKRSQILKNCRDAADCDRGLFTLTVPTGGGKTLSSMAFSLRHLISNGMRRIIYVIPYTSIIEQNAKVFTDLFGARNVLEHHSNYDFDTENDLNDIKKLACENWAAPIVVTTNVQFFESLFANKSSRCRKLHNIANSVIIFDEAQMLPVEYLRPCIAAIAELIRNYQCSAVLCSATQPSLGKLFPQDMKSTEICPDTKGLYEVFQRTQIHKRGFLPMPTLVAEMNKAEECLTIVNTRRHALDLYTALDGRDTFHLSTLMCPAHRGMVLKDIRKRLDNKQPCKVVSTQLIEAGVDVDFPLVYRAMCGLDSLIQSAGRCNREGKLTDGEGNAVMGQVHWFEPEKERQLKALDTPIGAARTVERTYEDISSPEAIHCYFDNLYFYNGEKRLDDHHILSMLKTGISNLPFATVAKEFKLNCGQVRGPVQLGFARSVDPIVPQEITITRVAITTEDDAKKKETEMGRKHIIPYALYRCVGYISANLARKTTGFNEDDLALLWEAIQNMFEIDHSAARGKMVVRELIVFKHENESGNCPAYQLFDMIKINKNTETAPRSFADYAVSIDETVLDKLYPYFFSQRIESETGDLEPIWHTNEYHVPNERIEQITSYLASEVKLTWFIHAFSNNKLIVVLKDKVFAVSLVKDETWNEMIEYGVKYAKVESSFLENIPLYV